MDDIAKSLDEQIQNDLQKIATQELGGEKRKAQQSQLAEMYRLRLEEKKVEHEHEAQKLDRGLKAIFETLGIVIPNGIALYSVLAVMKFEETGFVKTFSARRILGWVKPGKILKMFK